MHAECRAVRLPLNQSVTRQARASLFGICVVECLRCQSFGPVGNRCFGPRRLPHSDRNRIGREPAKTVQQRAARPVELVKRRVPGDGNALRIFHTDRIVPLPHLLLPRLPAGQITSERLLFRHDEGRRLLQGQRQTIQFLRQFRHRDRIVRFHSAISLCSFQQKFD